MIETIRKIFVDETTEQLHSISEVLDNGSRFPLTPEMMEKIFLAMHTIKGSGPMFGFPNLPKVSMPVEKTFAKIKTGQVNFSYEIGMKTNDAIKVMLEALERNSDDHLPSDIEKTDILNFFKEICP
ncbi:MAG: Hpt domain-containing protein [Breznakibacter sp.]